MISSKECKKTIEENHIRLCDIKHKMVLYSRNTNFSLKFTSFIDVKKFVNFNEDFINIFNSIVVKDEFTVTNENKFLAANNQRQFIFGNDMKIEFLPDYLHCILKVNDGLELIFSGEKKLYKFIEYNYKEILELKETFSTTKSNERKKDNSYSLLTQEEFMVIKTLELTYGKDNVKIITDRMNPNMLCFKLLMGYTRPYKFLLGKYYKYDKDFHIIVQPWEIPIWTNIVKDNRFSKPIYPKDIDTLLELIENVKKGKTKKYEELNRRCINYKRIIQKEFQEIYYYIINSFGKLMNDQFFYDKCKKMGIEKFGDSYSSMSLKPMILVKKKRNSDKLDIDEYVYKKISEWCETTIEYVSNNNNSLLYLTKFLSPEYIFSSDYKRYLNSIYKFNKIKDADKYDVFYK
jgi:hypothetical protein